MSIDYGNYINGEWVEASSNDKGAVRNPADTDDIVGQFQASTASDANAAVEAAAEAQPEWAALRGPKRGAILRRTSETLEARKSDLIETLVQEEGKTRSEATGEVQRAIDIFAYYAEKARDIGGVTKEASSRRTRLSTEREPVGVVGLITPWNYPIAIPAWKLAPALAAGNTAVLKPASEAPGVARELVDCLAKAGIPDGVANYVTGPGSEVGNAIVTHDDIDAISFTGSTTVGNSLVRTIADDFKRIQCEMGGKNPTLVMPSADVEGAATIVGAGAFGTTGQSCTATSRAIVHEEAHDEFLESIVDYAESLDVGPGRDDPDMGPQVSRSELDSTIDYIEIGKEEGATLETGGEIPSGSVYERGHFIEPTVFSNVSNNSRLAQEEIFGPVLGVIPARDFEHALTLANDIDFGLSASIVTQDLREANVFIDRVEAGVVKINEKTTGLELQAPFGGYKDSSINTFREQGDAAIDFYTQTKTVYRNY